MLEQYLEKKHLQRFTGAVKLGIERGVVVAISENNAVDVPLTETNKIPLEIVMKASRPDFFGTLVFEFDKGDCIYYAYTRTFKGDMLKKELYQFDNLRTL